MNAMAQMVKARTALVLDHFFFGSLALKLQLVEDTKCKTAATNGIVLKFNPKWIETLNMDQTKGIICHEVMHCALAHHVRRSGRDIYVWNEACDYAINPLILDADMKLPNGLLNNPNYSGMNVDHIYSDLMSKRPPKQENNDSDNKEDSDNEQGNAQNSKEDAQEGESSDSENKEQGNGQGEGTPDPGKCGGVEDYPGEDNAGASDSEKEAQAQEWQVAATQAATQAKNRGTLPGSIERLIKKLNEPKVNWREALHRFVDQIARNDYSFRRINTRFVGRGICLPSLYNEALPPIDVLIDTSGSLQQEDLEQFASEIDDILTQYSTTCRVYYADTSVRHFEEFTQDNRPIQLVARGGGGTDFADPIAHVMQQDEQSACLIYLTDLECPSFGKEPEFPVLWVCTQAEVPAHYPAPPFGEVIRMQR